MAESHPAGPASGRAFLARIPADARRLLLDDARTIRADAADVIFAATDQPRVGVLLAGRARRYLAAGDGRQVTTGYLGPGDLVGSGAIFGIGLLAVGALSDCVVAEFQAGRFIRLTHEDRSTREAFAEATTALVREGHVGLALTTFGTMRERVAHHLIALAADEPSAVAPVITMTQQRLADCVGTVPRSSREPSGTFVPKVWSRPPKAGSKSSTPPASLGSPSVDGLAGSIAARRRADRARRPSTRAPTRSSGCNRPA